MRRLPSMYFGTLLIIHVWCAHVDFSDSFFDNVCELDLVFNFYKVRLVLSLSFPYALPVPFLLRLNLLDHPNTTHSPSHTNLDHPKPPVFLVGLRHPRRNLPRRRSRRNEQRRRPLPSRTARETRMIHHTPSPTNTNPLFVTTRRPSPLYQSLTAPTSPIVRSSPSPPPRPHQPPHRRYITAHSRYISTPSAILAHLKLIPCNVTVCNNILDIF